jgi:hypothetical protein
VGWYEFAADFNELTVCGHDVLVGWKELMDSGTALASRVGDCAILTGSNAFFCSPRTSSFTVFNEFVVLAGARIGALREVPRGGASPSFLCAKRLQPFFAGSAPLRCAASSTLR